MSLKSKIDLKAASGQDAATLSAIHKECFPRHWNKREFADLLIGASTYGWLAGKDGFMLCRILQEESEILTFGVIPPARRRGIAAALLAAATQKSREKGAKRMFLEVSADNVAAISLYEKAGFKPISRRKEYYRQADGSFTDALVMACEIA